MIRSLSLQFTKHKTMLVILKTKTIKFKFYNFTASVIKIILFQKIIIISQYSQNIPLLKFSFVKSPFSLLNCSLQSVHFKHSE